MSRVQVWGFRDPFRFAGFTDFDSFVAHLESMYGPRPGDPLSDQEAPITEPAYEIDPALETLMRSPEFHRLNAKVKEEILKDQNLVEAFAKFLNGGGYFVVDDTRGQFATWEEGPPPHIILPNTFLNPTEFYVNAAVFSLAHEIYHNEYQLYDRVTPESWARNEAVATLEAFRATERMGIDIDGVGLSYLLGAAISIIKDSANDSEALDRLGDHFLAAYPPGP